jgi:predicted esterase
MNHQNQALLQTGTALDAANVAVIMVHGRGASAESILGLAAHLPEEGVAYLAPQAANHTWYPNSGFGPLESNEPWVSSAFQVLNDLLAQIAEAGISPEKTVIGGFSQGACLSSEFVARHAQRYGGLYVLSGALMGPIDMARNYTGSLDGTPVYIGGIDQDPWVSEAHMRLSADVLGKLGGDVTIEILPGSQHTVRESEVVQLHSMIDALRST